MLKEKDLCNRESENHNVITGIPYCFPLLAVFQGEHDTAEKKGKLISWRWNRNQSAIFSGFTFMYNMC